MGYGPCIAPERLSACAKDQAENVRAAAAAATAAALFPASRQQLRAAFCADHRERRPFSPSLDRSDQEERWLVAAQIASSAAITPCTWVERMGRVSRPSDSARIFPSKTARRATATSDAALGVALTLQGCEPRRAAQRPSHVTKMSSGTARLPAGHPREAR
jgi:hypothetical protein